MARHPEPHRAPTRQGRGGGGITKEFIVGMAAILLGGYNLLLSFGVIKFNITIPQIAANIVLVVAGLLVLLHGYKESRRKEYLKRGLL